MLAFSMRYYVVTTTKFAHQCVEYLTYGATQSNWLANVDVDDIVFLSQFNYKSQQLFGPFQVSKRMFYNKSVIYPAQRYFYRIQLTPITAVRSIEETDLYLNGIQYRDVGFYFKLINLVQQNKHLHCISLTDKEGKAIDDTFKNYGKIHNSLQLRNLDGGVANVDCEYIWQKNKLDKKREFASESDLESHILLSLKNSKSYEYKILNEIVTKHSGLGLMDSRIYNQFIFGNAYPADIVIVNDRSLNVFELKKGNLVSNIVTQVEKEIKKHLYFSLFSERTPLNGAVRIFNFYLVCLTPGNEEVQDLIARTYEFLQSKIHYPRKNNLIFLEYEPRDNTLCIFEA